MHKLLTLSREFIRKADLLLLGLCLAASLFGIIIVASTTAYMGSTRFVLVQTLAMIIGIGLYVIFSFIDIDILAERREILMIFNILFLSTLFVWGTAAGWPSPGCPSTSSPAKSVRSPLLLYWPKP